jgi:hypothetical protein
MFKSLLSAAGVVGNSKWKGIDHFQNKVERFLKIIPGFADNTDCNNAVEPISESSRINCSQRE